MDKQKKSRRKTRRPTQKSTRVNNSRLRNLATVAALTGLIDTAQASRRRRWTPYTPSPAEIQRELDEDAFHRGEAPLWFNNTMKAEAKKRALAHAYRPPHPPEEAAANPTINPDDDNAKRYFAEHQDRQNTFNAALTAVMFSLFSSASRPPRF